MRSCIALSALAAVAAITLAPAPSVAQTANRQSFTPLRPDGNGIAALARRAVIDAADTPLADVVRSIQRQTGLSLVFGDDLEGLDRRITMRDSTMTAARALIAVLDGTNLEVLVSPSGQAVLAERPGDDRRFTVSGTVIDGSSGDVLADAEVWLGDVHRRAVSDRDGRFGLPGITAGQHTLIARRPGYAERQQTVQVRADVSLDLTLDPQPTPLSEVIVTPGVFGVLEETVASRRTLTRSEIEAAPQIGEDVFRAVARLPGVVGNDLSAAFGVRGSTDSQVLLRLDGVELIEPYHLKDIDAALSIVDLDAIGGVELSTGGFGAQYGDRTAGVFEMRTIEPSPGRPRTTLGISLTNLRAATTGTFAGGRGSWLATARRGYLDLALQLGGADDPISPVYYDALARVDYRFGDRLSLSAHLLHAGDRLDFTSDDENPDVSTAYGSSYAWVAADAKPFAGTSVRSVLSVGRLTWDRDGSRERERFVAGLDVLDERSYTFVGLRQSWDIDVTADVLLRTGFDAQARSAEYAYDGRIERYVIEGDSRFIATDTTLVSLSPGSTWAGAWLSMRLRPAASVTLEAGGRWDRHTHTGDEEITPRLNVSWAIDGRTHLRAAWGRYVQAHGLHELQAESGETSYADAEHAEHRVVGIERTLPGGVDVRFEAFDRRQADLRPRWVNLDNDADFLAEATSPRRRVDPAEASSRGIELYARHRAYGGLDWSVAWSLSESKQTIDGVDVPAPRDQRQALSLDAAWSADGGWRFGAAWQYHTGWPRTPATMVADTIDGGVYVTRIWGDYNSARLPAYHRLDVRASREILTRRGRLLLMIDIYNVYNRLNARGLTPYVTDIRNGRLIVAESVDGMLPRLPSFGVQWTF